MTTVMANHGGSHEWDLTVPQVQEALYVRLPMPSRTHLADPPYSGST